MSTKFKICILVSLTFIYNLQAQTTKMSWQDNLLTYIKHKSGLYETILFIDNKQNLPPTIENFIQSIYKTLPSRELKYDLKTIPALSTFNPDSSLFIVTTFFDKISDIKKFAEFISSIAQNKRRPKLLIIIYQKTNTVKDQKLIYHDLLQTMWVNVILHATIVELKNVKNVKNVKFRKGYSLKSNQTEVSMMYYYNPYLNLTINENITMDTVWFPEKTRDLKGHTMKIGFHDYPPEITLKFNKSVQNYSLSGFSTFKMIEISRYMNFRLEQSFTSNWANFSCNKEQNVGFYNKLSNNEIQAAAIEHPRYSLCENNLYEFSRGAKMVSFSLVVPEVPADPPEMHNWKILDGLAVVGLVAFMWIVSHALHFDLREWHAIYMIQLVLNTATPHKPTKIEERIVFASMIWACFFHSSYIYMSFTDFGLDMEAKSKFESVQDVLKSGLQIIIDSSFADMIYNNSEGDIRDLLNKANKMRISEDECITEMITNKNLSCVSREDHAQYVISKIRDECGKPIIKILDESLWVFVSSTMLSPGSPYVKRFDTIIQTFIESGMIKKWQEGPSAFDFITEDNTSCTSNKSKLDHEINNLLVILGFGYMSCTTTIVCEAVVHALMKKFKNNRIIVTIHKLFH